MLTLLLAYFFVNIAASVELPAGLLPGHQANLSRSELKPSVKVVNGREGRKRRVANLGKSSGQLRSPARRLLR